MRHRRLIQRQLIGKITDADLAIGLGERSENRKPVLVGQGLKERRFARVVRPDNSLRRAASLYRHFSILPKASTYCQ